MNTGMKDMLNVMDKFRDGPAADDVIAKSTWNLARIKGWTGSSVGWRGR